MFPPEDSMANERFRRLSWGFIVTGNVLSLGEGYIDNDFLLINHLIKRLRQRERDRES